MHEPRKQESFIRSWNSSMKQEEFFATPSETADYNISNNLVREESYFLRACYARRFDYVILLRFHRFPGKSLLSVL